MCVQILIVTPAEGNDAEPYRAAQRWLDGSLTTTYNYTTNLIFFSFSLKNFLFLFCLIYV